MVVPQVSVLSDLVGNSRTSKKATSNATHLANYQANALNYSNVGAVNDNTTETNSNAFVSMCDWIKMWNWKREMAVVGLIVIAVLIIVVIIVVVQGYIKWNKQQQSFDKSDWNAPSDIILPFEPALMQPDQVQCSHQIHRSYLRTQADNHQNERRGRTKLVDRKERFYNPQKDERGNWMLESIRSVLMDSIPELRERRITFQENNEASYTNNKKDIFLKLRDDHGNYYDFNTLLHVALHEIAHVLSKSYDPDHKTNEFHRNMEYVMKKAQSAGLYNKQIFPDSAYV